MSTHKIIAPETEVIAGREVIFSDGADGAVSFPVEAKPGQWRAFAWSQVFADFVCVSGNDSHNSEESAKKFIPNNVKVLDAAELRECERGRERMRKMISSREADLELIRNNSLKVSRHTALRLTPPKDSALHGILEEPKDERYYEKIISVARILDVSPWDVTVHDLAMFQGLANARNSTPEHMREKLSELYVNTAGR